MSTKGRPPIYEDSTVVSVSGKKARSRLQQDSERRAIINAVVDGGGRMTIAQICEKFGYDLRGSIKALIRSGWLEVVEGEQS